MRTEHPAPLHPASSSRRFSGKLAVALLACLAAATLDACGKAQPTQAELRRRVSIPFEGGAVPAAFYPGLREDAPGLLLLHGRQGSSDDWALFATRARQAGFVSLALDLPPGMAPEQAYGPIRAGLDYLARAGIAPERVAVVGADTGANLALSFAADHTAVGAVVLVSPGLDYGGVPADDAMTRYGRGAVFLLAASGDAYAADSARKLRETAQGFAELREYSGAAHGTDIFTTSENATDQLLDWLKTVL